MSSKAAQSDQKAGGGSAAAATAVREEKKTNSSALYGGYDDELVRYIQNPQNQFPSVEIKQKRQSTLHTAKVTVMKYNREGDLMVSGSQDSTCALMAAKDMDILGVYRDPSMIIPKYDSETGIARHEVRPHAVADLDISFDSKLLVSAHGDGHVRLWDLMTGELIRKHSIPKSARLSGVAFSDGSEEFAVLVDKMGASAPSRLLVYQIKHRDTPTDIDRIKNETDNQYLYRLVSQSGQFESHAPVVFDRFPRVNLPDGPDADKGTRVVYSMANEFIVVGSSSGAIYKFATERVSNGPVQEKKIHKGPIKSLSFNKDKTLLASAGDMSAAIVNPLDLSVLMEWQFEQLCFSIAIHPTHPFLVVSTGVDKQKAAMDARGNEVKIYNAMFPDECVGKLLYNFMGPFNGIDMAADGKSFCAAGEDGACYFYDFPSQMIASLDYNTLMQKMDLSDSKSGEESSA